MLIVVSAAVKVYWKRKRLHEWESEEENAGLSMSETIVNGNLLKYGTKVMKYFLEIFWLFCQTYFTHHRL